MNDIDLMSLVQPEDGWFAIVGISGSKGVQQKLVATREEADEAVSWFISQGADVYFGLAKYKDDTSRSKENVRALKAFWMDIDCGPAKAVVSTKTGKPDGYIDQDAGLAALSGFCDLVGLSEPTIVNSGRGWHVYWPLEEEVTRAQWEPVAARLRELCVIHNFYADPSCFEVARILRVPDTFNHKQDPPLPVAVLSGGEYTTIEQMRELLGVKEQAQTTQPQWEPSERQQALADSTGYSFKKIMIRSAKGDGCNQLLHAYTNRATASYNEWFFALSVAALCDDAPKATHMLSEGHPDYNPAALDKKVATIRKATSCSKFRGENPELCQGCPHLGKVMGPKQLGRGFREAEAEESVIEDVSPQTGALTNYTIPSYPFPYVRKEGGGILRMPPKGSVEETEPVLVYENDLYVVKRMTDTTLGDIVVLRLHLPTDGIREFTMPFYEATEKTSLRKMLSMKGVVSIGKQSDMLMDFISRSVLEIQRKQKAEVMRQQFGWADNHTKFVIGDQEVSNKGVYFSPPSSTTQKLAKFIGPVGSLDEWKTVWGLYNREGLEPHAFAALSAFGAPLLHFLNQTGATINLYSPHSGTGKTTVLNMINSVWGHPSDLRLKESDTLNGKIQWLGILNNLPCTMDEVTNMKTEEFSDLVYALSNGKGKERMVAGSNELRENNTTWQTITVSTANASFYEKLSVLKNNPDGELMRLIEYEINPTTIIDSEFGKAMFDDTLFHNYGHAGTIFMEWVFNNVEEVTATCAQIQSRIDRELRLAPKERFWSATVAANIVGGLVARRAGLIDWDMARIYKWASAKILQLRVEVAAPMESTDQVVGDFVNRHMQNILVVNDNVDKRTKLQSLPLREPKGELLIRIEPDTKMMFISAKAFREYCVKYQISYSGTIRKLKEAGRYKKGEAKRMSKGTLVTSLPIHALKLDLSSGDFINIDNYIEVETPDAGGGS